MDTYVVGVLIGLWLVVMMPAVLVPWLRETRRPARPEPTARRLPSPAGELGKDVRRPAA